MTDSTPTAQRIVVFGGGAWGTAIAIHAAKHNPDVTLLVRRETFARDLTQTRVNQHYLPGCQFPDNLAISYDLNILKTALALIVTPVAGLADALSAAKEHGAKAAVWLCKGLNAQSAELPHELAHRLGLDLPTGVLSGPSFAQEVAQGLPTALTVASASKALNQSVQTALHHGTMRVYTSTDVVGVELGGALKNVIALACGISDGLELGLNARAALITRGLAETTRLALAMGAKQATLMGLTGVGDLVLTCTGSLSRNRSYGLLLAQGKAPQTIEKELGHVAEGARCVAAVCQRAAALGVDMPISNAVAQIVAGSLSPKSAMQAMMMRDAKAE